MNYIKERSKGKGVLLFSPHDSDKDQGQHTITCCHCNHVFIIQPGSGKERGWCFMCGASTCGDRRCSPALNGCAPFEKKLEAYERRTALPLEGAWDIAKGGIWVRTMREVKLRA